MTTVTMPVAPTEAAPALRSYQESADRIETVAGCRAVIESLYDAIEKAWDGDGTYQQRDAAVQELMLRQQAVQRRLNRIERQARGEHDIIWPRS